MPKKFFLDIDGKQSSTVLLAGMGRSGTTWLSEIINYNNTFRYMFEPFNYERVKEAEPFGARKYLRPESTDERFIFPAARILTGRIRNPWIDKRNRRFIATRRLIKVVRANLFLRWLYVNFPAIPIVFTIRHPLAVIHSAQKLGWKPALPLLLQQKELVSDFLEDFLCYLPSLKDEFEKYIFSWCIEHYVLFRQFNYEDLCMVFYEDMRSQPEREVRRVFDFLGLTFEKSFMDAWAKPSFTSRKTETGEKLIRKDWLENISDERFERGQEILKMFNLHKIYSDDFVPNHEAVRNLMAEE